MQSSSKQSNAQFPSSNIQSIETVVKVVINGLPSPHSKRVYGMAIRDFLEFWRNHNEPGLNKLFLQSYIAFLQDKSVGESSINLRLAAIRNLAREASELEIWPDAVSHAFSSVKNIPQRGTRTGKWLTLEQAQKLINAPTLSTAIGLRDRAMLATLLGCGLRRQELVDLSITQLQKREGRWILADLIGKRNKVRTVAVPKWTKLAISEYIDSSQIPRGRIFQSFKKNGQILRNYISSETVRFVVERYSIQIGVAISPHDLRRTYAKLALKNGAKIEQIQLSLGHSSLTTTQKYLGTELDLVNGPGDYIDLRIS